MRTKLLVAAALAAVVNLACGVDAEPPQVTGKWSGRIERPGEDGGRRMAQMGTAEFSVDHRFVCSFESPDQQPLSEQGTWSLKEGQLWVTTSEANGSSSTRETRRVDISHEPLEMRLPVKSGAWFLVLRPLPVSK